MPRPRQLPAPYSCADCGEEDRYHGMRYTPTAGLHTWRRPDDALIKARMEIRRLIRRTAAGVQQAVAR